MAGLGDAVGGAAMNEQQLLAALAIAFGHERFDATDLVIKADDDRSLAAALDAWLPTCRYRSGWQRGRFRVDFLRRNLRRLRNPRFRAESQGERYWTFKIISG